ncbi:glycerate 2-kinase [Ferroplasma acidiphilum]|uniref:DUF4147 domain-containing protein n=1 Tax=Ferroplasma acidiphilum TaxID=74969 RepID=A0A1V0N3Q3_9ARCH|nr:glycerate 2-kinase [Ferroplasma acidiphilum]ARD84731.1 glycerate kinase [Ferroplasma acidiphilum]NOL60222.1 DUF4147 domain-containing protein [Ferroplasma acidiphilum]WMT53682.1 MAG: glycerate 2-kinase [Ferroplasma acidiphilum]
MQILNMDNIGTNSRRVYALEKIQNAINNLNPAAAMSRNFNVDTEKFDRVYVIGFGKASFNMYSGIRERVLKKLSYAGIIIPDDEVHNESYQELEILRGTHPYVSSLSVESSKKLLSHLDGLTEKDLVIVLISGGGSSLFELLETGIDVNDLKDISAEIMENDGDIYVLNRLRSSLSAVKNGKLAKYLYPASVAGYIISDVVYDNLNIIASGPLVNIPAPANLKELAKKYIKDARLRDIIEKVDISKTLDSKYFTNVKNTIVLKNRDFVDYIYSELEGEKINLGSNINGDVKVVSRDLTDILRNILEIKGEPFWFVCGGETTVTVTGNGSGGRNQELAVRVMENMGDNDFLFISMGTDGIDGKSIAAGGIVDNSTRIENLEEYLASSDTYTALSKAHGAIITGRTGNNVSDIMLGFYGRTNNNF